MDKYIEKRKYERFDTEVKIHFYVPYDLKTKVNFEIKQTPPAASKKKYEGVSRNISAGGICFSSSKKLEKGDGLILEVYLPQTQKPILMEGKVCWSQASRNNLPSVEQFDSGVQLTLVNGKSVEESIYFDHAHQVIWSAVLEMVLGSFSKLHKKVY